MKNLKLQQTGYEKPHLTLQQLLDKGRAHEAAQLHLKHLNRQENPSPGAVNRVRGQKWFNKQTDQGQSGQQQSSHQGKSKKNNFHQNQQRGNQSNQNQSRQSSQSYRGGRYQQPNQQHQQLSSNNNSRRDCPFCGNRFHEDGLQACPAKGYQCYHCNNWDHFAHMCQIKSHQTSRSRGPSARGNRGSRGNRPSGRGRVHNVDQDGDDEGSSEDEDFQAHLEAIPGSSSRRCGAQEVDEGSSEEDGAVDAAAVTKIEKPSVQLILGDKKVCFLLDTGASNTIINQSVFRRLQCPPIHPTAKRIFPYKQPRPLELSGRFSEYLAVPGSGKQVKEKIYVLAEDGNDVCILSCSAAKKLNLICFSKDVQLNLLFQERKNGKLPPVGRLKGVKVHLYVDKSVPPVAVPYRPKNLHDQELEVQEVRALEELDLIETVTGPTPFVSNSVIAWKPGGFRYCQDYRFLNKALLRTYHHLPTVDGIVLFAAGYKYFSVIDLISSYHQLELDEESRQFTTFNTPLGLRRYKVLPYGLSVAPEIFHNVLRELFQDLMDVLTAMDDLLIRGRTKEEHDRNLAKARQRLIELNLTSKEEKEQICQEKVRFWGIVLSADGVQMDPRKVKAIKACGRPENQSALKSFLGMINYCARFVKGQADVAAPLRELAKKSDAEFVWSQACERAFEALKAQLTGEQTLAYFDINKRTELMVDASPIGLGAILSQIDHYGNSVVVAYASKVLSPAEQNYGQIDREMLAIVWGCLKFGYFLRGCPEFTVWTDHQPLVPIFNNPNIKLTVRMEKWMQRMLDFSVVVKYLPGGYNAADYLSRHPDHERAAIHACFTKEGDRFVQAMVVYKCPNLVPPEEIAAATRNDADMQLVSRAVSSGRWRDLPDRLNQYQRVFRELSLSGEGIILRGDRICIPASLQRRVVRLAHEGHQGSTRTKQLLRAAVWFPGMDRLVEDVVKCCAACQVSMPFKQRTPLVMSSLPNEPWSELSMDFYTFSNGEELAVIIDDYSRYPIAVPVQSTAFRYVESELNNIFALFGVPVVIRTDNGPPFNGKEFAAYARKMGFRHRTVTYAWPEANGEAERFMRTLGKTIRTAIASGVNWMTQLQEFLRNYRMTPHPATGVSPAEALMGRVSRGRLPDLKQSDDAYKQQLKEYADRRRRVKEHPFAVGDHVWLKKEGKLKKKTEPFFEPEPFVVVSVYGPTVTARNKVKEITRNASFFKKVVVEPYESDAEEVLEPAVGVYHQPPPQQPGRGGGSRIPVRVRPVRDAGLPVRLREDYVVGSGRPSDNRRGRR